MAGCLAITLSLALMFAPLAPIAEGAFCSGGEDYRMAAAKCACCSGPDHDRAAGCCCAQGSPSKHALCKCVPGTLTLMATAGVPSLSDQSGAQLKTTESIRTTGSPVVHREPIVSSPDRHGEMDVLLLTCSFRF